MWSSRPTLCEAFQRKLPAFPETIATDRYASIFRTAGNKSAAGTHDGGDNELVEANEKNDNSSGNLCHKVLHFHFFPKPARWQASWHAAMTVAWDAFAMGAFAKNTTSV